MGDVVVIGAGLAGLRLARILGRWRRRFEGRQILFVDTKRSFDYLPVLPDLVGGRLNSRNARLELAPYLARLGVNFTQGSVTRVDTQTKEVTLADGRILGYAVLVVACGSVTDFYGLTQIEERALKIDTAEDAVAILEVARAHPEKKFVVVGGGYTGIEIASNLARTVRRRRTKRGSIAIVERADDILAALPEWMQDYCRVNLSRQRVVLYPGCSVLEAGADFVKLSNGILMEDTVLIWAAGVRPPDFLKILPYKKDGRGRLIVDAGMRCAEDCFAVGDAASFEHKGRPLRMAVQFALAQADVAAAQVVRTCLGRGRVRKFRPFDWGYLIPMANGHACGEVVGLRVWGWVAGALHYFMCLVRSVGGRMRLGLLRDLMTDNVVLRRWHI